MVVTAFDGPALRLPGGYVLLAPRGVSLTERAVALAVRSAARDGITTTTEVSDFEQLLVAAADEARADNGTRGIPQIEASSSSPQYVDAAEVGRMLGCSQRNVRALASRGSLAGRKVGGSWLFDVDDVIAYRDREDARAHV